MLLFQCRGIDASIFQLPSKIHLTIGMLTLLSDKDVVRKGNMICSWGVMILQTANNQNNFHPFFLLPFIFLDNFHPENLILSWWHAVHNFEMLIIREAALNILLLRPHRSFK